MADYLSQILIISFSLVSYYFKKYFPKTTISMAVERCVCSIFKLLVLTV